ncbi:MAG: SpaA isopeptide-forming pilin-related protein, partial [Patescibacteria group bacterium]|nr:SpaA isopeptide-forming pilin-related protein [Patescibacteria group bacterium]
MTRRFARRVLSSLLKLAGKKSSQTGQNAVGRRRLLRVEHCEDRAMLASVTGVKYQDMAGDGFTGDDLPLGGFTINLYSDTNDNGVLDGDDLLIDLAVSDATTGAYGFSGLTDGRYFLREQPQAGWTQTAGPAYYTFDVIDDNVYTDVGLVVDSFAEPDPEDIWVSSASFVHVGSMLGGERELLIEVLGTPGGSSTSGSVGTIGADGTLAFGTGGDPGTKAVLTYDGTLLIPLSEDLTGGGVNTAFRLDMTMLQVAGHMDVTINLVGPEGSATFTGELPESASAKSHYIPFADFVASGTFSFEEVTSIQISFNPGGVPDVDFILDAISIMQGPRSFDFGNYQELPDITGVKYHDIAGNGITADDLPLGGFSIQLYRDNGDGVFNPDEDELVDTQVTDATTGEYTFSNLTDGRYFIREVAQAEWTQTVPLFFHTLDVAGQAIVASDGFDFANTRDLPTLSGVKWHDITGNGITTGDVPLGGFTIELYLDADGDGLLNVGVDTLVATQVTDATTGAYTFTHLLNGIYFVREVVETDWTQTSPLAPEYYTIEVADYTLAVQTGYDFANTREL